MAYSGNQPLPGLHPINNGAGNASPRVRHYTVPAAYATAVGEGNMLIKTATGLNLATGTIAKRSAVGVAAQNSAASTLDSVAVYDDPAQEYACIVDTHLTNAATLIAMIGRNVAMATNVLNTTLGQGKTMIDISTQSTTVGTTKPFQIVRVLNMVGDTLSGTAGDASGTSQYAQVIVKLNDAFHMYGSQSGTNTSI